MALFILVYKAQARVGSEFALLESRDQKPWPTSSDTTETDNGV